MPTVYLMRYTEHHLGRKRSQIYSVLGHSEIHILKVFAQYVKYVKGIV